MSDREKIVNLAELYLSAEKGCLCTFKAKDVISTLLSIFKPPETAKTSRDTLLSLGILKLIFHPTHQSACKPPATASMCPTLCKVQEDNFGLAKNVVVDLIKNKHQLIAFSSSKVLVALCQFSQFQEKEINQFLWNNNGRCILFTLTAMEKILFLTENIKNKKSLNTLKEANAESSNQSLIPLKENSSRIYLSVLLNPELLKLLSQEQFTSHVSSENIENSTETIQTVLFSECLRLYQTSLTCFYGDSSKLMDCLAIRSKYLLMHSGSLPFPLSKLIVDIYYYILTLDYSTYLLQRSKNYQPSEQCIMIAFDLLEAIEEDGSFFMSTLSDKDVTIGFGGLSTVSGDGYQTLNLILLKKHFLLILLSCFFYLYKNQMQSPKEYSFTAVRTVNKCLQTCLNAVQNHHESIHLEFSDCLVSLFGEEDDLIILALSSSLDMYKLVKDTGGLNSEAMATVKRFGTLCSPHKLFMVFLSSTACHDHSLLLDLLLSTETFFLHYLVQYLKLVHDDWSNFYNCHLYADQDPFESSGQSSPLDRTMSTLIRLRLAIEKSHTKGLFPYAIEPLVKLLFNVETIYENK